MKRDSFCLVDVPGYGQHPLSVSLVSLHHPSGRQVTPKYYKRGGLILLSACRIGVFAGGWLKKATLMYTRMAFVC
ncbi:MAG: hypothetical protein LBH58_05230 [Tannerellaceae bacterium]|nr:hypothetical protein [Tannerellaceae bacterium]